MVFREELYTDFDVYLLDRGLSLVSSNLIQHHLPHTVDRRAFPVFGGNKWNDLPPDVTSAPSLSVRPVRELES